MNLLYADERPDLDEGKCFRLSWVGPAALLCIMIGLLFVGVNWLWTSILPLPWIAYVLCCACVVACIIGSIMNLRAHLASSNWVMLITEQGLYINLRSHLMSRKVPQTQVEVAYLSFDEIDHVHKTVIRYHTKEDASSSKAIIRFHFYLDIILSHENTESLRKAITALHGLATSRKVRCNHRPVLLPNTRTVRIQWAGRAMTRALESVVRVEPALKMREKKGDLDKAILARVENGDYLDAIRLVRLRYGMGISEAKQFVRQMTDGKE